MPAPSVTATTAIMTQMCKRLKSLMII